MNKNEKKYSSLPAFYSLLLFLLFLSFYKGKAEIIADTTTYKKVKRYIRPCLYFNHYATPRKIYNTRKQYRFAQNDLGFYLPLYTKTWTNRDSVSLSTLHIIGTVDLVHYKPSIDFLNEYYTIGRLSAGLRVFYSNGSRNIFYFSINPFLSQEINFAGNSPVRFAGAFIYNRTVSASFSFRLGIARSYTFGRVIPLPVVGFRIGPLDKLHLNIQLPRNISMDFPMGKSTIGSVFIRGMGGIYNVVTQDSIVAGVGAGMRAQLRRYEMLHGMQFNFRTGKNVSFYLAGGFATRRTLRYAFEDPTSSSGYDLERTRIPRALFLSFGLSIRFGQSKKIYNNILMYDVMDLNTLRNAGFNETGSADKGIPADPNKYTLNSVQKYKYKDVEDLITDEY